MKGAAWCSINLFRSPIYYGLCLTEASFNAELKRLKVDDHPVWISNAHSDATTHFFNNTDDHGYCAVVCLRIDKPRIGVEIAGLLIHEAVHIWQEICARIGEQSPSHEFEAYSVQWISQQLIGECFRQLRKHR